MGLKLRTQIAGILFFLFALTVVIIGYFNMSLLSEALRTLSEEQATATASSVARWAAQRIPADEFTEVYLHQRMNGNREFEDYLNQIPGLRVFEVLDSGGRSMWSFGRVPDAFAYNREAVGVTISSGRPYHVLWEYTSSDDAVGRSLEGGSPLIISRWVAFQYYSPVLDPTTLKAVGVIRVSFYVNELGRRLRIMLLGNVLLSAVFLITAFISISIWTSNAINRPLDVILQGQERIGRGDFSARVSVDNPSTNEIVNISSSFNRMAADLRRFKKELEIKTIRLEQLNGEYRRLNEHLESEVEEKTRELTEFFSVVTHDMKVPLAAIQGYTDLLIRSRNNPLNEKQQRFAAGISSACTHLLGMTRNMLESVKYDAGKINYYIENFDLYEVINEVVTQLKQQAEEKGVTLDADVPPLCRQVQADRTKIMQVLINLVNNAVKFTPEGGSIHIRARDRGLLVEVEVSDSGAGITEDQLPHLFQKFTQFHTQEGAASSIGLGLYIVKKILEGHGQTIRVESSTERGTSFSFTLAKGSRLLRAESLDHIESASGAVPQAAAERD